MWRSPSSNDLIRALAADTRARAGRAGGGEGSQHGGGGLRRPEGATQAIDFDRLAHFLGGAAVLNQPFPFDDVGYNRCALQLSSLTRLGEIHALFSGISGLSQVWITSGGWLQGVVTDRALIEACLAAQPKGQSPS